MTTVRDFPLFPLGLVALPSELIPLHIFEERYKTMIGRCREESSEFGIVWMADDGLRPIGCACEITEVLERMEEGRMNILTRGTRPFRIVARQQDLAYPAGEVEALGRRPEQADDQPQARVLGAQIEQPLLGIQPEVDGRRHVVRAHRRELARLGPLVGCLLDQ